ncbi:MAG TPA: S53 family peptidase [Streptosporangiaceae bacterium]|nr:S53 family peptidase [Streptosporangiaceae bacterium]
MKHARWLALSASFGLAVSFAAASTAEANAASTAAQPHRITLRGSSVPATERAHSAGSVAAKSKVSFDLVLKLRNASGAAAFVRAVSSPGSRKFHHYLSDSQWVAKYGATRSELAKAESWLRSNHFTVNSVPKDRLFVATTGTARQVERTFGVTLGYYMVNGHKVRLANGALSIPASMSGIVTGAAGVNESVATPELSQTGASKAAAKPAQEPAPPAGFRNPQPCSKYWGQKIDTADSTSLYAPYTGPLPYDVCGYKPAQLRGAYGLAHSVATGTNGKGVTIAIVDAYDSPTLLSDAQLYFRLNDPSHPLSSSQFTNIPPATVGNEGECAASGWFDEQALDVEASHSMAPGANIQFVGAQDCLDSSLLAAENTAISSGASVVSNSWGDFAGDLFTDAATHTAFDDTFMVAASTGVSVMFSSGDDGDNFAVSGLAVPDYPATSPFVTAVGGTSLEVSRSNSRTAEYGWSTAKQVLCTPPAAPPTCGSATTPTGTLAWQAGGGGGTSYYYTQPYYQAPVVPSALALRNENIFGPTPLRVIPDIAMDADANTGMLIGLTQTFPDGVYYDQFKEGGTSLASPLLAGVIADADQAAGVPLGFLNPVLYKAYAQSRSAFFDVNAPANPDAAAVIRVDYGNTVDSSDGYVVSVRAINYAGPETYCDGTGNCATRDVTLTATKGFDSLTGLGSVGSKFITVLSRF